MSSCRVSTLLNTLRWKPTSPELLQAAQTRLLAPHIADTDLVETKIPLRGTNSYINAVTDINSEGASERETVFLAHGYGAGLGFWCNHLAPLASTYNVVAFDWLGMGGSSRASFPKIRFGRSDTVRVRAAEEFFIDPVERMRKELNVEKFHLIGHSLGGYLSAAYAAKYPKSVNNLVLVSPVGVPPTPPDPPASERERMSLLIKALSYAWSANVTPMSLIRTVGPWGPNLVKRVVTGRFSGQYDAGKLDDDHLAALQDYVYHISAAKGSGEYALNAFLKPIISGPHRGIYARESIGSRLAVRQSPTVLVYGSQDWMFHPHVPGVVNATPKARLAIIHAGHHLYFDNPEGLQEIFDASLAMTDGNAVLPYEVTSRGVELRTVDGGVEGVVASA